MYARISTFRTGPDTDLHANENATMLRVLANPGCRGMYFLKGTENDTALAITLWDSEDSLAGSREPAEAIRADSSAEQHLTIVGVEEFEVTSSTFIG
jgi:heme-degrading monooxygenase HmoA